MFFFGVKEAELFIFGLFSNILVVCKKQVVVEKINLYFSTTCLGAVRNLQRVCEGAAEPHPSHTQDVHIQVQGDLSSDPLREKELSQVENRIYH
jgi:hypothetical protein